jgi:hypothetical protein
LHLPGLIRLRFVLSASLFIAGAIGFELIGGGYGDRHGFENMTYAMIVTLEESLEMAGVIVFIHALISYIETHYGEIRFRFQQTR